jgi:hypothetical protein
MYNIICLNKILSLIPLFNLVIDSKAIEQNFNIKKQQIKLFAKMLWKWYLIVCGIAQC